VSAAEEDEIDLPVRHGVGDANRTPRDTLNPVKEYL